MCRLLLICEFATLNGGERSLLALLPRVKQAGFRPIALAPAEGPLAQEFARLEIEVVELPLATDDQGRRDQTQSRAAIERALVHIQPQLLHANSMAMSRLVGPVAAERSIPSLGHLRDMMRPSRRALVDLGQNTRLVAVSQATRSWYAALGVPPQLLTVAYNGVDCELFRPRPATGYLHRELGLPAEAPLVASIGQLGMRKGVDTLLQAAAEVARADAHFLIVGERHSTKDEAIEYETALRRAADKPPLAGRCHFLGRRNDVPQLLNELTLLVHAARQEPLGRVLLEAAAAGTPVVASRVGGTEEIFPPRSESAALAPAGDVQAFASAIHELLADPQRRRALAERARQRVESHFTLDAAGAALLANYRSIVAN